MKRSVVIALIENLLGGVTEFDLNGQAENLLCNLEELGMTPPKTKVLSVITVNEWEEETDGE